MIIIITISSMQFHLKIPRSGGSKKEEKVNRQSSLWKICTDGGIFYRGRLQATDGRGVFTTKSNI